VARWAEGVTILGDGPLLMERICGRRRLIQVSDDVGLSGISPLTDAFSVQTNKNESESSAIRSQLKEEEYVETVFCYLDQTRINFPHSPPQSNTLGKGHRERKEKLSVVDIALPAAPYDLRLQLASEVPIDRRVDGPHNIPSGWNQKRVKRRRSYSRIDKSFAWRIDVTEVTTTAAPPAGGQGTQHAEVGYEIEMELSFSRTQELIQMSDEAAANKLAENLARQLWTVAASPLVMVPESLQI
jgi:hypothetical protein